MEDLVNMIISDANASDVSDKIKELLYTKAAESIDAVKPYVSASMFGDEELESEEE